MKIIEPTKPKLPITTPKYKDLKNVGSYTGFCCNQVSAESPNCKLINAQSMLYH